MKENLSKNIKYFDNEVWSNVNKTNKGLMEYYLRNKKNLKPSSIRQYENAIRIFFMWVYKYADNVCISDIKKRHLLEYQNWLIEQKLTLASIKFKRSALSSLYDFLVTYYDDEYPDLVNIVNDIPVPVHEFVSEKRYITEKEMKLLREELSASKKFKQLAFIEITYFTGLKKEEILELDKDIIDIRYNNNGLYPVMVNERKVYFNEESMESIRRWLEQRGNDGNRYVFVSNKDGIVTKLNPTAFNYWCSNNISNILGREIKPSLIYKKFHRN